ncbi:MAG: threonine--tRNA ligase [Betaproteobacteria bacterium AqS2]|uniref:Threonine--tRNA ligase n=1 Tax=Candidatus Amphirhobacter heronislandensis TaxID=1732024 RepID=A0A930UIP4_9GAMM|nr:threonine--tRNA ligase [Betaproteobacteria bacterium AqS2]
MADIELILPDGARRAAPAGCDGAAFKQAVAVKVDGELRDLDSRLPDGGKVAFITRKDDEALELIRHDLAHVMAQAVAELHPTAQPTIGPVIADGFFYDFHHPAGFTEEDLAKIEARMRELVAAAIPIRREVWERDEAKAYFQKRGEPFKAELVDAIPEGEEVSVYRQGDFLDLCRGPHMPTTRHAGTAFKLTAVAGSYWRGDAQGEKLQRIYGTAWRSDAELKEHLTRLEEAKRRDHRLLGPRMGLFHLQDEAAGSVFWHPQGWTLYRGLANYMRARLAAAGYLEVRTPQLISRSLWEKSGHWAKFRANMYLVENEEGVADYAKDPEHAAVMGLKPMNCPGHVMIFAQGSKSYRDLPLRYAEFGACHRCEPRGALHGVMRVRAFTQDDGHIFCSLDQIVDETVAFVKLLDVVYRDLGFADYTVRYADRPALRAGTDAQWDEAERQLTQACERAGIGYEPNPGDGAFYGPKLEFVLRDTIGREWQCGTLQVDLVLPGSLGASYTDAAGQRQTPVLLHRAVLGSFERFIGILIENCDGHLPLWLADPQVTVATIVSEADGHARAAAAAFERAGLRAALDLRNEKINYKVREHSAAKAPVIAVVGKSERDAGTVTLRRLGSRETSTLTVEEAAAMLGAEARPPHLSA